MLDAGAQNINVNSCNKEHTLLSADNRYGLVQKQVKGVRGILSPHHMYIDKCTSYASTPYSSPHKCEEASPWSVKGCVGGSVCSGICGSARAASAAAAGQHLWQRQRQGVINAPGAA